MEVRSDSNVQIAFAEIFANPDDRLGEEDGAALAEAVEKFRNSSGNRLSAQRKPWAG